MNFYSINNILPLKFRGIKYKSLKNVNFSLIVSLIYVVQVEQNPGDPHLRSAKAWDDLAMSPFLLRED